MSFVSSFMSASSWTFLLIGDYPWSYLTDMLLNLGKAEGSVDAGQMIKPALARGLQLVGATTRQSPNFH